MPASILKLFFSLIFFLQLCLIGWSDYKTMLIPNKYILFLAMTGVLSIPFFPEITLLQRLLGMICISVPMLLITLLIPGGFGGGDIKLMAAAGLFLGFTGTVKAFVIAVLFGGVYAIWLMLAKKADRKAAFAFGPFLCLGMIFSIFL